ncbi:hypothetical protein D3C78_1477110 [compost metagenome]
MINKFDILPLPSVTENGNERHPQTRTPAAPRAQRMGTGWHAQQSGTSTPGGHLKTRGDGLATPQPLRLLDCTGMRDYRLWQPVC